MLVLELLLYFFPNFFFYNYMIVLALHLISDLIYLSSGSHVKLRAGMAGYQNQSLDNILDSGSHLNQNSELHPVGQGLGQGLGGLFQPRPEEFQGKV